LRIGHLKEVTFADVTLFAVTCAWIAAMTIYKALWLPKELIVWAVKNLWAVGLLIGCAYGFWKLGDIVFYYWLNLEY
jgi:hypothetical protein